MQKNEFAHIAAALVPTATFAAVPRTPPPPKPSPQYTAGLSSTLLNSTMLSRMFATPVPPIDDGSQEVDTSIDDYADPGYSVVRREGPVSVRPRVGTPELDTDAESPLDDNLPEGYYSQPADSKVISLRGGAPRAPDNDRVDSSLVESLYATPKKRKPITEFPAMEDLELIDDEYLGAEVVRPVASRPPVENEFIEPMIKSSSLRHPEASMSMTSPVFSDQEFGDTKGSTDMEAELRHHLKSQPKSPRMEQLLRENEQLTKQQTQMQNEIIEQRKQQEELKSKLSTTNKQTVSEKERQQLINQQMSMTDNTLKSQDVLIQTLQDRIQTLELEKDEHHELNSQLQNEIESFRQYIHEKGSAGGGGSSDVVRRQIQDLKDENDTLKASVHKLNIEISRLQAKYRRNDENKNIAGLPSKGPIPSWLINTKYLAPMFLAYDDRLSEKNEIIKQYEMEQESFRAQVEEVLKENQRLHIKLEQTGIAGNCTMTEWQQLQEQAKLVLEENQLLLERLAVQQEVAKDQQLSHTQEVSRLSKQTIVLQQEKDDAESELMEIKQRYNILKNKHNSLIMETESKLSTTEHDIAVSEIKRNMDEVKESHHKEIADLLAKQMSSDQEKTNMNIQLEDLIAEKTQMEIEIKGLQKSLRRSQKRNHVLQNALEISEEKESSVNNYLTNVLKAAEQAAVERDTYAQLLKTHDQERRKAIKSATDGNVVAGKLEERIKVCKEKCAAKISQTQEKMKEIEDKFQREKWEYERQIRHLNLLLKEKEGIIDAVEGDKKRVETDLQAMWRVASADNRRMKETMEKSLKQLREHQNFTFTENNEDRQELLLISTDA
ncbi:centrosomal protein of 89 kDa-like isoform X2 [Tubulanus polymorphus]|uniref:centrosomal protein of 89 kDa-like isoform X2 n=1 Tax=Tubulanus polymorphus TaxID=672921 RepID=UPI003DA1F1CA